jgi:hypothetical protein
MCAVLLCRYRREGTAGGFGLSKAGGQEANSTPVLLIIVIPPKQRHSAVAIVQINAVLYITDARPETPICRNPYRGWNALEKVSVKPSVTELEMVGFGSARVVAFVGETVHS